MSTKRSVVPFSQNISLFTERNLGVIPTGKAVTHGNTITSQEINIPSQHAFGMLMFAMMDKSIDTTASLAVKCQYKIKGTGVWTDAITIGTVTGIDGGANSGKHYRLDATLAQNWIPNVPIRFTFTLTGNLSTDTLTIQGSYVV
jgi:hypothetical protein